MQLKSSSSQIFRAIDLFAGGGGLTVGLKRAGFNVISAVEIEQHAFSTYKANHPEVQAYKQDIRTITGKSLLKTSQSGKINLLSGCPPCQGFSSLTSKYRRNDPRNELVSEMSRLVEEIKPSAVMMENVPGLSQKGNLLFEDFILKLKNLGYIVNWSVLQVADYGVPQNRRRLVLLAGLGFSISLPKRTHSRTGGKGLLPWRTLRDAIGEMPEPIKMNEANKNGGPQKFNWHVVRVLSDQNIKRLEASTPGLSRTQLDDSLRPPCHRGRESGFSNVYGRMSWDQVPVTMTGGCTTLSKGRFGHPEKNRTISVREAALIQTFPQDYIIDTPFMDYACNIIGNALPCDFAEVVATQCYEALKENFIA